MRTPQGSETRSEIAQDTLCMAAKMIESREARGRPVIPKSVALKGSSKGTGKCKSAFGAQNSYSLS